MHYSKSQLPMPFCTTLKNLIFPAAHPRMHARAQIELLFKNSLLFTISISFVGDSSERIKSGNYCVCALPAPAKLQRQERIIGGGAI
jgi:hypothetical protein